MRHAGTGPYPERKEHGAVGSVAPRQESRRADDGRRDRRRHRGLREERGLREGDWASTASSCTARMATSSTSSSGKAPTSATTAMAARWRSAPISPPTSRARCARRSGEDFPILLRFSQWKQQDFTAQAREHAGGTRTLPQTADRCGRRHVPLLDAPILGTGIPRRKLGHEPCRLDEEALRQADDDRGLGQPRTPISSRRSAQPAPKRLASTACSR